MPTPSNFTDALVLTGPTGSGKSAVSLEVAEALGCEIVAMDSMTLYRGMDIGTAKPSKAAQARVPHHLIDVLDPWESGSVAWWLGQADVACQLIRTRGKRPLFVGGTPFYLKALRCGLYDAPPIPSSIRAQLESEALQIGKEALHQRLALVDPKSADRLHVNDVRRVIRALEVHEATGRPISSYQQTWITPKFADAANPSEVRVQMPCIVIDWPREELYRRINTRVEAMLASGWEDEVRKRLDSPHPLSQEASHALGYQQLVHYIQQGGDRNDLVARIQTKTRQFAKRQLTSFRHLPECVFISGSDTQLLQQVIHSWSVTNSSKL